MIAPALALAAALSGAAVPDSAVVDECRNFGTTMELILANARAGTPQEVVTGSLRRSQADPSIVALVPFVYAQRDRYQRVTLDAYQTAMTAMCFRGVRDLLDTAADTGVEM